MNDILIAAHVKPDGDAIGAMLACGLIGERLGKRCLFYLPGGVPGYLDFLKWPAPICASLDNLPFEPRSAIYVDCCEPGRLGDELAAVWDRWPTVNIDHHLCGPGLGSLAVFINSHAAAACELVAYVAKALDLRLDGELAEAIALGLITDTGNFTHGNTTAAVFGLCAELERNGCRITAVGDKIRSNWSMDRLKLWGALFTQARQAYDDRVVWSAIYQAELARYGCTGEDLEGFIDILRRMRGVEIAITVRQEFTPEGEEVSRVSLRSGGDVNVQEIATKIGGGGHKNASGGTVSGPPWRAVSLLLEAIGNYYHDREA